MDPPGIAPVLAALANLSSPSCNRAFRSAEAQAAVAETLAGFAVLGSSLLMARGDDSALAGAVNASCGWTGLEGLVAQATQLQTTVKADVLAHVSKGFHRFKLYARRMLNALEMTCASVAQPLLTAAHIIRDKQDIPATSLSFLLPRSKWRPQFRARDVDQDRLWVVAVLLHLRDAFRSGDIWLPHSRRHADMKQALVPIDAARAMGLIVPLEPEIWIADRKRRLEDGLKRLAKAARTKSLPGVGLALEARPLRGAVDAVIGAASSMSGPEAEDAVATEGRVDELLPWRYAAQAA